jgi:ferritin-like metal-binding protein YciE
VSSSKRRRAQSEQRRERQLHAVESRDAGWLSSVAAPVPPPPLRLAVYLKHAHAMERALAEVLAAPLVLDAVPVIRRDIEHHRSDCLRHAALLAARLHEHGHDPRSATDSVLGSWVSSSSQADDPALVVRALLATQELKLSAYEVLEDAAAAAEDAMSAATAGRCRSEEEARKQRITRVWVGALATLAPIAARRRPRTRSCRAGR